MFICISDRSAGQEVPLRRWLNTPARSAAAITEKTSSHNGNNECLDHLSSFRCQSSTRVLQHSCRHTLCKSPTAFDSRSQSKTLMVRWTSSHGSRESTQESTDTTWNALTSASRPSQGYAPNWTRNWYRGSTQIVSFGAGSERPTRETILLGCQVASTRE
jgi:hypothetical protein